MKPSPPDRAELPTHQGLTWLDMPGRNPMEKRMTFALFKRGKLALKQVAGTAAERRVATNFTRPRNLRRNAA